MASVNSAACIRVCCVVLAALYGSIHPARADEILQSLLPLLTRSYALTHPPEAGRVEYYRVSRVDVDRDARGAVTGRTEIAGIFRRALLYVNGDGTRVDRYTWKSFTFGRTDDAADSVRQTEIGAIRGFFYDVAAADRHSVPPLEIGGLAKTPETFAFFTVVWDVAAFFSAVTPRPDYPFHTLHTIGDRITETAPRKPADFDFTPVVSRFAYTRQPLSAAFTGLSLVVRTPCAVVHFEAAGNPVSFDLVAGKTRTRLDGSEDISGRVYIALKDTAVVRGEMRSRLIATQRAVMPGRQVQTPIIVDQYVTLERAPRAAYER